MRHICEENKCAGAGLGDCSRLQNVFPWRGAEGRRRGLIISPALLGG
jgi:hypothetical protein